MKKYPKDNEGAKDKKSEVKTGESADLLKAKVSAKGSKNANALAAWLGKKKLVKGKSAVK